MKFSPYDFDVVSGSPEPREAPKERPRPAGANKKEGADGSADPAPEPAK